MTALDAQDGKENGTEKPTTFVLIDYENIQPEDIDLLRNQPSCKVLVFAGPGQKKISIETVKALQPLGTKVEYTAVARKRKNAVDFFIAYYLGVLTRNHPDGRFYIIANDTGYDPLLDDLGKRGMVARRCERIAKIPGFAAAESAESNSALKPLIDQAVDDLIRRESARPKTRTKLHNALRARFRLSELETDKLIKDLAKQGYIKFAAEKVTYHRMSAVKVKVASTSFHEAQAQM